MGGALHRYRVSVNGYETVMQLTDEDAAAYPGAERIDEQQEQQPVAKMRPQTRNKARIAATDKGGGGGAAS